MMRLIRRSTTGFRMHVHIINVAPCSPLSQPDGLALYG